MAQISGFFGPGEGKTVRIGNINLTFLNPLSTQGDYSIYVSNSPPGSGQGFTDIPMTSGTSSLRAVTNAKSGTRFAFSVQVRPYSLLGGTIHGLKNLGPGIGRQMGITSPAGVFEEFITEVVDAQVDSGNPAMAGSSSFREIAAKYGVEFVSAPA